MIFVKKIIKINLAISIKLMYVRWANTIFKVAFITRPNFIRRVSTKEKMDKRCQESRKSYQAIAIQQKLMESSKQFKTIDSRSSSDR